MHGCQIARKFPLPISYYSEDSSEAWHKLNRRNMRDHSRQNSRQNRIVDEFCKDSNGPAVQVEGRSRW